MRRVGDFANLMARKAPGRSPSDQKGRRRPSRPGKNEKLLGISKGGQALANGLLETIPAEKGGKGGGNPKLVLKEETVDTIVDRLFAQQMKPDGTREKLQDIIESLGIPHKLFWQRMNDTPELRDAVNGAREGMLTYEIDGCVDHASKAFDRDSAAAAQVKIDEVHKRAGLLARSVFGRDAGKDVNVGVNVGVIMVPAKEYVPAMGVPMTDEEIAELKQPTKKSVIPGRSRLLGSTKS